MSTDPADHTPVVPASFVVPETLETSEFRLCMLTVCDVVADFDAEATMWARLGLGRIPGRARRETLTGRPSPPR